MGHNDTMAIRANSALTSIKFDWSSLGNADERRSAHKADAHWHDDARV
jgi:hypothetical protein